MTPSAYLCLQSVWADAMCILDVPCKLNGLDMKSCDVQVKRPWDCDFCGVLTHLLMEATSGCSSRIAPKVIPPFFFWVGEPVVAHMQRVLASASSVAAWSGCGECCVGGVCTPVLHALDAKPARCVGAGPCRQTPLTVSVLHSQAPHKLWQQLITLLDTMPEMTSEQEQQDTLIRCTVPLLSALCNLDDSCQVTSHSLVHVVLCSCLFCSCFL